MFKLANTFANPGGSTGSQQGFAPIGAGQQVTGDPLASQARGEDTAWSPLRPTQGAFSYDDAVTPRGEQQGFPPPLADGQRRPPGSMNPGPMPWGGVYQNYTPYYSRGAAAYVPNFGKVTENPIGAGVVALHRPQAFYGPAADYENGAIWWTSQAIPTSVSLQGLTDPAELGALLGDFYVQGVVRTTG